MNILITGTKGFIGKNLASELMQSHNVILLENGQEYSYIGNKFIVNLLDSCHIDLIVKEKLNIDVIIHTASRLASSSNLHDISLLKDNILMYEHLSKIINKFNPKQIINLSSIAVYPNIDGEYKETSEIRPSINNEGLYGLSKFVGENMLDLLCKKTNILNLRLGQVYGQGMRTDRIFEIMKKELKERNIISVYGNGRRVSGFIHIESLIKKVIFCINKELYGIYNLSDENLSYKELALQIIKEYGNKESKIELVNKGVSAKVLINNKKIMRLIK